MMMPMAPTILSEFAVYAAIGGQWHKLRSAQYKAFRQAEAEMGRTGARHASGNGGSAVYNVRINARNKFEIQLGGGTYHELLDYHAPPPPSQ